jgi:ParB/RepB/Spo0J family partition protein
MLEIHEINPDEVQIPPRQRGVFDQKFIVELADSIKSIGQLQPGVCRKDQDGNPILISGENRLRACKSINALFRFIYKEDITDPAMLYECELMENLLRRPLTWREEVESKARLHELRQEQRGGTVAGRRGGHSIEDTASELHESKGLVSEDIKLALYAREIPEVANAASKTEAKKAIKRLEGEVERSILLEKAQAKEQACLTESGESLTGQEARLLEYDKRVLYKDFEEWYKEESVSEKSTLGLYQVVLFDPPWGVDFDASAKENSSQIMYEDSKEYFLTKFPIWCKTLYDLMAENAHLYVFFGIANYPFVYQTLAETGFSTNGIPIIWQKQGAHRTRNPTIWPGRSYEPIAYARKGSKDLVKQGAPDVITTPQPTPRIKQIHPSAKHPAIYRELLVRSASPGDRVLDPMAGSCMAGVAADSLKISHQLDWLMIEKEESFRNLGIFNLNKGYWTITDDTSGEDPEDIDQPEQDFKLLEPGSQDWMNFWRLHPNKQSEMLAFRGKKEGTYNH